MIKKILSSLQISLAFQAYRRDDIHRSRIRLNRYFEIAGEESPTAVAFDATLMILERRSQAALGRFQEARGLMQKFNVDNRKYIEEYCRYYECLIEDGDCCEIYIKNALESGPSEAILRWLPLPGKSNV